MFRHQHVFDPTIHGVQYDDEESNKWPARIHDTATADATSEDAAGEGRPARTVADSRKSREAAAASRDAHVWRW